MKIGLVQSNYIPWRGYFDFIREVDAFVIHDDIQYTKGDWRNRNKIKTPQGTRWLTVPVHYAHTGQLICDTKIDYATDWQRDHINLFAENYRGAPYAYVACEILHNALGANPISLSHLNRRLIQDVLNYLNIRTPLSDSRAYALTGRKTERIIQVCKRLGATEYLSGPAAKVYLDEDALRREGITPLYKTYDYAPYPQLHGAFNGNLSVLDLIANIGPDARNYLSAPLSYAKPTAGIHISHTLGGD